MNALSPAVPAGGAAVSTSLAALALAVEAMDAAVASMSTASFADLAGIMRQITAASANVAAAAAQVAALLVPVGSAPAETPSTTSSVTMAPPIRTSGPWVAGTLYAAIPTAPLAAIADNGEKWFAITRGKYIGLTKNSAISINATTGVSGRLSPKFSTQLEALDHFNAALSVHAVAVIQG
ncbi:hypothetical protein C8R46DRAFT_1215471 [Mycena filopes]|nr:hypothetical protein C8R46DRAFT_1215471 [Mycena filopes]